MTFTTRAPASRSMNAYERFMITTGARPFSINEKERTEKSGKFDYRGYETGNKKHL